MKSTVPMLFSICLFVTGLMFGLSGFNEQVGIERSPGLSEQADRLNNSVEKYEADQSGNADYLGMHVEAVGAFGSARARALPRPLALVNVRLPGWFALSLGTPIQFVSWAGVWQIVRGFRIR